MQILTVVKKKALTILIEKYAGVATPHGISAISRSRSIFTRVFWTILFLGLFIGMTVSVVQNFRTFFRYKTVISIEIKQKPRLRFPSLTICRNNQFSRIHLPQKYEKMVLDNNEKLRSNKVPRSEIYEFVVNTSLTIEAVMENQVVNLSNSPPWILNGIPGSCSFAGMTPCDMKRDFKRTFMESSLGTCYTFNSEDAHAYYQYNNGPQFGVSFILYVNQSDYLPLFQDDGAGFALSIHHHEERPDLQTGVVFVSPGQINRVGLSKREINLKQHPYPSNCSNGKGIKSYFSGRYSTTNCKISCTAEKVVQRCGFVDKSINDTVKTTQFRKTTVEMLKCRNKIVSEYIQQNDNCDCPSACVTDQFIPVVSTSRWPSDVFMPDFKLLVAPLIGYDPKNITDEFVRANFVRVDVYYDTLAVEKLNEEAKGDWAQLLSDIGGMQGLWLGSSMFSILEAITLVIGMLSILLRKNPAKMTIEKDVFHENSETECEKDSAASHKVSKPESDKKSESEEMVSKPESQRESGTGIVFLKSGSDKESEDGTIFLEPGADKKSAANVTWL